MTALESDLRRSVGETDWNDEPDESEVTYDAIDALRWSHLSKLRRSPLHFRAAQLGERDDTEALLFGRALHARLLGGARVVAFDGRRDLRTKAYQEFLATHRNCLVLSKSEFYTLERVADAVSADDEARAWLERLTTREETLTWTERGMPCKARLDGRGLDLIGDLKSCKDPSPFAFARQAGVLGYHMQLAWYRRGYRAKYGGNASPECILIAAGKVSPFAVCCYRVTSLHLDCADTQIDKLLDLLIECRERDEWPGPSPVTTDLALPEWTLGNAPAEQTINLEGLEF